MKPRNQLRDPLWGLCIDQLWYQLEGHLRSDIKDMTRHSIRYPLEEAVKETLRLG